MARKKILFISHSGRWHGSEKALGTLITGIDRNRFSASVVVPEEGPLTRIFRDAGIRYHVLPLQLWIPYRLSTTPFSAEQMLANVEKIAEIIRTEQIDIVHTNTSIIAEGAIAARQTGTPHVWHLHEFLAGHPSLVPQLPLYLTYRFIDLFSEAVVTVSSTLKDSALLGIRAGKLHTIANGIGQPVPSSTRKNVRRALGISDDAVVITAVGNIQQEKGYDTLFAAALQILAESGKTVFLVAGEVADTVLQDQLEGIVAENNLQPQLRMLGYRKDVADLLTATDIFVCSSLTESFGLALVEAMALGKPVVSTRCGGPEETVIDGETGFLVPIGDSKAMAQALTELIASPERRQQLGEAGRQRFQALYTTGRYCQEFERLYTELGPETDFAADDNKLADALLELLTSRSEPRNEPIEALLNSMSWKITAPLRKIYDFFFVR